MSEPISHTQFDTIKTIAYPAFHRVIDFYKDFNYSCLSALQVVSEAEFDSLAEGTKYKHAEVLSTFYQFVVKFDAIDLQMSRFKRQCLLKLESFAEVKQILIEVFKQYLSKLIVESTEWYDKLYEAVILPHKNSKYFKFFQATANFCSSASSSSVSPQQDIFGEFLTFCLILDTEESISDSSESVISTSNSFPTSDIMTSFVKIQELTDGYLSSSAYKDTSPLYQKYLAACRTAKESESLEYHEYLLELKLVQLNLYQESAKKATNTVMNKNLLTLYKIAFLLSKSFDEQDDLIFWILTRFFENVSPTSSAGSTETPEKNQQQLQASVTQAIVMNNSDFFYFILGELLCNSPDKAMSVKPDLKNRIKQLYEYLTTHVTLYCAFPKLLQLYKQNQAKDSNGNGAPQFASNGAAPSEAFVYSLYENQSSSYIKQLGSIMELLHSNGVSDENPGFDKFLKNDVITSELYKEVKSLVKLGNAISANQNKVKKQYIASFETS